MNIEVLPMNFNHVGHKKVYQLSPCAIHQCFHFVIFIQNNLSTRLSLESISHHLKDKESESKLAIISIIIIIIMSNSKTTV